MSLVSIILVVAGALLQPSGAEKQPPATPAPAAAPHQAPKPPAAGEPNIAEGSATFDAKAPAALEVKRSKTGQLLVKPTVNGKDAGWFIFDTGAGICVVSTPHVEALGLKKAGAIGAVGVGGQAETPLYRAASVVLGPMTMADHPVIVTDLSFLKQHLGEEIAGVIGYGVLARSVAEIDLKDATISLFDPATYELRKGAAWRPLNIANRTATVHATFDGGEGDFGLDTGANGFVTFHEPITREKKLLEGRETREAKLGGVGGFVRAKKAELAWFEVGGVRVEKVDATFALEAKGTFANAAKAGNIGTAMLEPFVLVFDYPKERISFVKREGAAQVAPTALSEAKKIEALLTRLEASDAIFIRNGGEHTGKEAAEHLRGKLESASERVKTAADFIEHLASKSSLSGKAYRVKLSDGGLVEAREWFEGQLRAVEKGE
jgi:hypothetical protein